MVEDPDTVAEKFMLETMLEMLDHLPEHTRIGWLPDQNLIVYRQKGDLAKKSPLYIYFMSMSG